MGENVKPIIECTFRCNMNQEQFPEAKKTHFAKWKTGLTTTDLCLRMYENGILKVEIKRTETKTKAGPKNVGFRLKHLLCRLVLSLCSNVTVLAGILFLLHPPGLHRSYLRSPAEPVSISTSRKIFFQTQICSEFLSCSKKKSQRKDYSCYQIVNVRLTL